VTRTITDSLAEVAAQLQAWRVPEGDAPANQRGDLPRRGHPLLFPVWVDERTDVLMRGRVRLPRYYHGHNDAAHGGAVGLFFDDTIGSFVASLGQERMRTAFLHINYRSITPLERMLDFRVEITERVGRKTFIRSDLRHGEMVCADAEMLMVALRPEQP
jgi:hypothetical protein